jgi:hypothetical protein
MRKVLNIRIMVYYVLEDLQEGEVEAKKIKTEILYFDGCPTYREAEKMLREVLAVEGIEAQIEMVAVNSDEDAGRLRFPGSPTIRVDGDDLFPVPERPNYALGCRMYSTPQGLKGSPTPRMLRDALAERGRSCPRSSLGRRTCPRGD